LPYAEYLHFDDAVKLAKARINRIDPISQVYAETENASPYFGMKDEPKMGLITEGYLQKMKMRLMQKNSLPFFM